MAIAERPQIVTVILGMHRSGTSMLTRILNIMGIQLGWQLQQPGSDNPKGFWENRFFQAINAKLLLSAGCDTDGLDDGTKLKKASHKLKEAPLPKDLVAAVKKYTEAVYTGSHWGWKDPRTVITWPFWDHCLKELGYTDIRHVVLLRHPISCLQSLKKRGDIDRLVLPEGWRQDDYIMHIWKTYYELIESYALCEAPLLFQEDLINSETAAREMTRCSEHLGLERARISPALATINPDLVSYRQGNLPESDNLQCMQIYERFAKQISIQRDKFRETLSVEALETEPATNAVSGRFCIYIVSPDKHIHSQAFDELALCLYYAFLKLGYITPIVNYPWEISGTPIVLGANLLPYNKGIKIPKDSIIYNLEQIFEGSPWLTNDYINLLHHYQVWDYSTRNMEALTELGIQNARLCRVGYVPELTYIPKLPETEQDIDILFYGILNIRRTKILEQLENKSLNVASFSDVYGTRRDRLIARAKIVINIHFYESKVMEIVRLAHLLANKKFVISEKGNDEEMERPFEGGIVFSNYDSLVDNCMTYIKNPQARNRFASKGHNIFSGFSQTDFLGKVLQELSSISMPISYQQE